MQTNILERTIVQLFLDSEELTLDQVRELKSIEPINIGWLHPTLPSIGEFFDLEAFEKDRMPEFALGMEWTIEVAKWTIEDRHLVKELTLVGKRQ